MLLSCWSDSLGSIPKGSLSIFQLYCLAVPCLLYHENTRLGASSTVITPVFSTLMANTLTNIVAFNQSRYFQKNASGLKEAQIEINGTPVYPFPQPPHLIKNNNFDAFDIEGDNYVGDYPGLQSLEQWTKYGFVQAVSFEHHNAWKDKIISGYPNPTGNLLTIKWSPIFDGGNTNKPFF
jgi:hypothetical protein